MLCILLVSNGQSASEIEDLCGELAKTRIEHTIFIMPNGYTIEPLNIVGEKIIPQVRIR